MRIISGIYKGRKLYPPSNLPVRPTTDFAKEALFNVLNNLLDYESLEVLDLFAGTGSISYEFISRGTRHVTSVDQHPRCISFIHRTILDLGIENLRLIRANALTFITHQRGIWDLVFADPPFDLRELPLLPEIVLKSSVLKTGGYFILEHPGKFRFSDIPGFDQHRNYGEVNFTFFRK